MAVLQNGVVTGYFVSVREMGDESVTENSG
jgi:hypothetical protein